jgi:hypothetical protein
MSPDELQQQRSNLMRQGLEQVIENKLLYEDFLRAWPEDKVAQIRKKLYEKFDEEELEALMKKAKVSTPAQWEVKLRGYGSSIQRQKDAYVERMMGASMVHRNVKVDREVTHQEMLEYYWEHLQEYERPAQATWEQLTVRLDRFPDKRAAFDALCWMGNQVVAGAPFADIARRYSHGVNADEGGFHDWTTRGSLVSQVLDQAVFTAPLGEMSPILEDERGLHIIRVTGRREAGRTPFTEAQADIEKRLRKERLDTELKRYVDRLRKNTRIWTIFDDEPTASVHPATRLGRQPRSPQ